MHWAWHPDRAGLTIVGPSHGTTAQWIIRPCTLDGYEIATVSHYYMSSFFVWIWHNFDVFWHIPGSVVTSRQSTNIRIFPPTPTKLFGHMPRSPVSPQRRIYAGTMAIQRGKHFETFIGCNSGHLQLYNMCYCLRRIMTKKLIIIIMRPAVASDRALRWPLQSEIMRTLLPLPRSLRPWCESITVCLCVDCDDVADTSACCILLDDAESLVEIIDDHQVAQQVLDATNYFYPRPTQPSIPPGSVNEYQLRLGRQRQVWFIPLADERGVCR